MQRMLSEIETPEHIKQAAANFEKWYRLQPQVSQRDSTHLSICIDCRNRQSPGGGSSELGREFDNLLEAKRNERIIQESMKNVRDRTNTDD